jgi:hypothetical protein
LFRYYSNLSEFLAVNRPSMAVFWPATAGHGREFQAAWVWQAPRLRQRPRRGNDRAGANTAPGQTLRRLQIQTDSLHIFCMD